MKKFFSLILVAMLSLSPIYALATEDTQAQPATEEEGTPTTEETPAVTEPAPAVEPTAGSEASSEEKLNTEDATDGNSDAENIPTGEAPKETIVNDSETKTDTPEKGTSEIKDKKAEDDSEPKVSDEKTDIELTDEEKEALTDEEKEALTDEEKAKLDEEKAKLEEEKKLKEEQLENEIPEHVHEFEYISNNDGTHTIKCIAPLIKEAEDGSDELIEVECDYLVTEECTYEDDKCKYCHYEKPKEEEEFNPSISINITNSSCTIGKTNPIICMSISQKDFDIEYAQVCFANYSQNRFINVGLAQGKYFDYTANDFVYTGSSSWYSSPDIDAEYAAGKYSVRSYYVRSTTGESVHYSVESGNLNENIQDISIELTKATPLSLINDLVSTKPDENDYSSETTPEEYVNETPSYVEPDVEEPVVEEPVVEEPVVDEPVVDEPVVDESKNDNSKTELTTVDDTIVEQPTTDSTPSRGNNSNNTNSQTSDNKSVSPNKQEIDNAPTANEKTDSKDTANKSNTTTTNNSNTSKTQSNSNTNQNSSSNSVLDFLKKIFKFW